MWSLLDSVRGAQCILYHLRTTKQSPVTIARCVLVFAGLWYRNDVSFLSCALTAFGYAISGVTAQKSVSVYKWESMLVLVSLAYNVQSFQEFLSISQYLLYSSIFLPVSFTLFATACPVAMRPSQGKNVDGRWYILFVVVTQVILEIVDHGMGHVLSRWRKCLLVSSATAIIGTLWTRRRLILNSSFLRTFLARILLVIYLLALVYSVPFVGWHISSKLGDPFLQYAEYIFMDVLSSAAFIVFVLTIPVHLMYDSMQGSLSGSPAWKLTRVLSTVMVFYGVANSAGILNLAGTGSLMLLALCGGSWYL